MSEPRQAKHIISANISIPGCSKPLVLEPCEVAWLESLPPSQRLIFTDFGSWKPAFGTSVTAFVAAVYECALRDAVDLWLWEYSSRPTLHRDPEGVWEVTTRWHGRPRDLGKGPTPLHAWRAAAKHLDVGPWTQ